MPVLFRKISNYTMPWSLIAHLDELWLLQSCLELIFFFLGSAKTGNPTRICCMAGKFPTTELNYSFTALELNFICLGPCSGKSTTLYQITSVPHKHFPVTCRTPKKLMGDINTHILFNYKSTMLLTQHTVTEQLLHSKNPNRHWDSKCDKDPC